MSNILEFSSKSKFMNLAEMLGELQDELDPKFHEDLLGLSITVLNKEGIATTVYIEHKEIEGQLRDIVLKEWV